jgi:hypothetical protein
MCVCVYAIVMPARVRVCVCRRVCAPATQELIRRRRELTQLVSLQHMEYVLQLARDTPELGAPVLNLVAALVARPTAPPEAFMLHFSSREGTCACRDCVYCVTARWRLWCL